MPTHLNAADFNFKLCYDNPKVTATQLRIAQQRQLVLSLKPGSEQHKIATSILILLEDSLHILIATQQIIKAARKSTAGR